MKTKTKPYTVHYSQDGRILVYATSASEAIRSANKMVPNAYNLWALTKKPPKNELAHRDALKESRDLIQWFADRGPYLPDVQERIDHALSTIDTCLSTAKK